GEQPGDQEDRAGRPFVGPAGRVLDEALAEAGIDRETVYVTNAVKHFKWRAAGKRRLHEKPNRREVAACRLWLDAELAILRPQVVVCLGATAATAPTKSHAAPKPDVWTAYPITGAPIITPAVPPTAASPCAAPGAAGSEASAVVNTPA